MKKIVMIAAAVWLVAACSPKEDYVAPSAPQARVFKATMESTRTFLDGKNVCWETDWDEISVFDKSDENLEYVYSGEDGATQGTFTTEDTPSGDGNALNYVYASYPYDYYNEASEGSMLVWFSPSQEYIPGSFGACPMVAVSEDENLQFYNLCGFLRIPIYGNVSEGVSKVYVYGNNEETISGDLIDSVAIGEEPTIELGTTSFAYKYTYVSAASPVKVGSSASKATDFWICLPPITFEKGIYVEVEGEFGSIYAFESSNPLTIKRSTCTSTAPVEIEFPALKNLGQGMLTDGLLLPLFGDSDVTVTCNVYEEVDDPGVYRINGFQCALAAAFFGVSEDVMAAYEGDYWKNATFFVDATDPEAVSIPDAEYGIYTGSSYGWVYIGSKATGTLANNEITFPANEMYVGLSATNLWYYGNINGTFKLSLPLTLSLAPAQDPTPAPATKANKRSGTVLKAIRADKNVSLLDLKHRPVGK